MLTLLVWQQCSTRWICSSTSTAQHNFSATLDIVATFSGYCVAVNPPGVISHHSPITCYLSALQRVNPLLTRVVRSWRKVDRSDFTDVKTASEMTYTVLDGALNSAQSNPIQSNQSLPRR